MTVSASGVPTPQEPEITEEMVERAAHVLARHLGYDDADELDASDVTETWNPSVRDVVDGILAAALAGRTVVELPEATGHGYWRISEPGVPNTSVQAGPDELLLAVDGYYWSLPTGRVGAIAAALLAAVASHEPQWRLASESRKDGETHGV